MSYPVVFTAIAKKKTMLKVLDVLGKAWATGEVSDEIMMGALLQSAENRKIARSELPKSAERALAAFTTPPEE